MLNRYPWSKAASHMKLGGKSMDENCQISQSVHRECEGPLIFTWDLALFRPTHPTGSRNKTFFCKQLPALEAGTVP